MPPILEVAGIGAAVKLAVELRVDEGAIRVLVHGVGVVTDPGAGEQLTGGSVRLEQWPVTVAVASVVVLQAEEKRCRGYSPLEEEAEGEDHRGES